MVSIVAGLLESKGKTGVENPSPAWCRAELIVMALFQHKIVQASSQVSKAEIQAMEVLIASWIDLVAPQ